ncbi:hypothetical protein OUZ56_010003 [Daphnia magna]|uniref:Uncharacterized protein n=1 Tax=Daphnia magna TaxID=35525 RepID=A0ABR0AHQ7_9CRUS|nr:hypothetical protein OUZ56_010003 [Daphnia magna]
MGMLLQYQRNDVHLELLENLVYYATNPYGVKPTEQDKGVYANLRSLHDKILCPDSPFSQLIHTPYTILIIQQYNC